MYDVSAVDAPHLSFTLPTEFWLQKKQTTQIHTVQKPGNLAEFPAQCKQCRIVLKELGFEKSFSDPRKNFQFIFMNTCNGNFFLYVRSIRPTEANSISLIPSSSLSFPVTRTHPDSSQLRGAEWWPSKKVYHGLKL